MLQTILVLALVCVAVAFGPAKFTARSGSRVILSMKNIVETLEAAGNFKTLVAAVKACKLEGALSHCDKLTLFAPNDNAFSKLPAGTVEALLKDISKLTNILLYHIVKGEANPTRTGKTFDTLLMDEDNFPKELSVKIMRNPEKTIIYGGQYSDAMIEVDYISCDNGQIHIIDNVLLPD